MWTAIRSSVDRTYAGIISTSGEDDIDCGCASTFGHDMPNPNSYAHLIPWLRDRGDPERDLRWYATLGHKLDAVRTLEGGYRTGWVPNLVAKAQRSRLT